MEDTYFLSDSNLNTKDKTPFSHSLKLQLNAINLL